MDHLWKSIGILGFEVFGLCTSHPVPYHNLKDVLEAEVPGALLGVSLLLVSVVCIVACVCCKERRNGFKEFRDSTHSVHQAGLSFTNPASELSIFPPPGVTPVTFEPLPSLASLSPRRRPPGHYCQAVDLDDWFSKKDADFPRHQLQFLKDCGRGWFGRVVEGEAAAGQAEARQKVMVRILREDATPAEQRLFLGEVRQYRDLAHANVLGLVGRCLETQPYLVLMEASAGDLKSFLRGGHSVLREQGVCLSIMCQVTEGLKHMIEHGFVHTDLAARNCQVTADLTVKVGDYGTSIETYKDEYYIAGDVAVPVRWCAPETLHCTDTTIETKQVTPEANVWSLGVLLWEVCQLGEMPYTDLTDDQVIVKVLGGGVRLPPATLPPRHAPALYSLMCHCWGGAGSRPELDHVLAMLCHLRRSHSEEDFQRRWDALKPTTSTPEITLETMTARSDFDSGVDLEIKSTDRDILDLVKKSSSDVNITPRTSSPQLSLASSCFVESPPTLQKQQSPSLTNLHGSVEDISAVGEGENKEIKGTEEFDSWLQGVETTTEEDVKFVKKISEAIKDLDDALALEKTSSSSDDSRQESPTKEDKNPVLNFRLGPMSSNRTELGAMQPDSLLDSLRRDSSGTDTEEETWRGRIERGEFSEKVKEKSKSVTDLMILTHIESEGSETDSLPSLTRQYSVEKKRKFSGVISTVGFGSEGNIRGAVLGEEFQDALKQLQAEWKSKDMESRENSLQFVKSEQQEELDFLSNEASEKPYISSTPLNETPILIAQANIVEAKIVNNNLQQGSPFLKVEISDEKHKDEDSPKSMTILQSPETSESSQTESSSETSTPTQYEVVHVKSFIDSERAHSTTLITKHLPSTGDQDTASDKCADIVPNHCEVDKLNDNLVVSSVHVVSNDECLVSKQDCTIKPAECVVSHEDLLSNIVGLNELVGSEAQIEVSKPEVSKNVPLTMNDFLLDNDESTSSLVPEIVVTEASILDVDSESENEVVLPTVNRERRSVRFVMSNSDSESEDEKTILKDSTVSDKSGFVNASVVTSTPFFREGRCISVDESVSDVDPTFPEVSSESFIVSSKPADNQESSVILGSCEDFTLDYFKGLKTTFGKQTSDESTDEFSKSEDEMDDKPLNNWDAFMEESHRQRLQDNIEEVDNDLERNNKNREENTFVYGDHMDILNPKINFGDRFNDVEEHVMICDRMDLFENMNGKQSQDQQMEEVKNRLEDVAKLSESFCLKNHSMTTDEDEDGKLLTPDDERSSDSGFRDKGSLSESVEDGCDEKYNLEDIEAELEQTTEAEVMREREVMAGTEAATERQEERLNKLDIALDSDIDRFFQTSQTKGWYLHPPPGTSMDADGWLPSEAEENGRNLDINEEFVTAIRNELREKLPCAQNPERSENEEDVSPEEERADLVIQYNTYPAPLSPILEERESISSNQSSLLLDEMGKSLDSSGKSSPVIFLDMNKVDENLRFEEDIKSALDFCSSESTESDNIMVTVEDLEGDDKTQKVKENPKEEIDDLLIVDTETNDAMLYESPRPKSQLAFVKQVLESAENSPANSETYTCYHSADDNMLSVDRNNLTCTPDSCTLSPMSTGSSRTGVAVSFSSSESGGSLSGFYLSPSSVRSDLFDNGPPSLPFDLGLNDIDNIEPVEEFKQNNEAEEIVQDLVEAGVLMEESESKISDSMETKDSKTSETVTEESSFENLLRDRESAVDLKTDANSSLNSNVLQVSNLSKSNCDKVDKLLNSQDQIQLPENELEIKTESQDWLKSVLLSNTETEAKAEASASLDPKLWPRAEELLPVAQCEVSVNSPESPSVDLLEVAARFYDVNSTLAISTPNNISFDESKDNSQLSSFTSTPTVESKMFSTKLVKPDEESSVPSLSNLANEIVLRFPSEKSNASQGSSPDDPHERIKILQDMTLALETFALSKAPMPSPEDADKGLWRPTMNQLMELTRGPEAEDMMTTSFIDTDNDNDNANYAPDWESDNSDDSEEHSSSSGEFIWRGGDKEEAVRVIIACDDLEPQECTPDQTMARISEGEEEDDDDADSSSCGSTTEFVPSTWDRNATPTKSALRSAEKKKGAKRNVSFKRQKYHCVYEYPREAGSDDEGCIQRPCWQSPSTYDYSTYSDWEYGEGEVESEEEDADESGSKQLPDSEYDFYRLSNLDFDMMTQMNLDDGEFFISSSARPFAAGDACQFFPGGLGLSDDDFLVEFQPCAADTEAVTLPGTAAANTLDETVNTKLREVEPKKSAFKPKPEDLQLTAELSGQSTPAEVSPTLGELRHTREKLKLDLGRGEDRVVGSEVKLGSLEKESKAENKHIESPEKNIRVEERMGKTPEKKCDVEDSKMASSNKLNGTIVDVETVSETNGTKMNSLETNCEKDVRRNSKDNITALGCLDETKGHEVESVIKFNAAEDAKIDSSKRFNEVRVCELGFPDKNKNEESKFAFPTTMNVVGESKVKLVDNMDGGICNELFGKLDKEATDSGEDSGVGSSDKLDQVEESPSCTSRREEPQTQTTQA